MPCLNAAWAQVDPDMTPALLTVLTAPAPADSCSPGSEYSFHCTGQRHDLHGRRRDDRPWNQYADDDFSHGITRLAAAWVISHEYGHHLQNVAGIFGAAEPDWEWQDNWRATRLANHGPPENHRIRVDRGYQGTDPCACNTFTAPSAEVI